MKKIKGVEIYRENHLRVVRGKGYYEVERIGDLRELVKRSARVYSHRPGFLFKDKNMDRVSKSYRDLDREVDMLGTALCSLGFKGHHISILSENRYEWGLCYFSIINGTGVAVPLDKYLPRGEVLNLTAKGKVKVLFYSPQYHEMMLEVAKANGDIEMFISMEPLDKKLPGFTDLPSLLSLGEELLKSGDTSFINAEIDVEKMSILLFTSGTTSLAKGVMLSHKNITSNMESISSCIKVYPDDVHLSLLPLHHTFENTIGLMYMISKGVAIAYCDGIKHIAKNLGEYDVSLLVAVPAIFEVIYKRMWEGIRKSGKENLVLTMIKFSDLLRKVGIDLRRQLFKSIFRQIGPKLRLAVSGAAPLDPGVVVGFEKIGLTLLQGYGLTETSPVVCANNDFVNVPGTIGLPLGGIEVAIDAPDEDGMGEIVTRGGNVMLGYYENEAANEEVFFSKGWFRTGDLGIIDEGGIVKITGRAKSMIVLTNGKKAFPEEYETILNNMEGVTDSYVWGNEAPDGDIQVCAKLVVDRGALGEDGEEFTRNISEKIRVINEGIPLYKRIRYFLLTGDELEKTTTMKIKRHEEYEKTMAILKDLNLDMRKASGMFVTGPMG